MLEAEYVQKSLERLLCQIDGRLITVHIDFNEPDQITTFIISDATTQTPIHTTSIQQIYFSEDLLDKNRQKKIMPPLRRLGAYIEEIFKKK